MEKIKKRLSLVLGLNLVSSASPPALFLSFLGCAAHLCTSGKPSKPAHRLSFLCLTAIWGPPVRRLLPPQRPPSLSLCTPLMEKPTSSDASSVNTAVNQLHYCTPSLSLFTLHSSLGGFGAIIALTDDRY